jgi:hypothetical protein
MRAVRGLMTFQKNLFSQTSGYSLNMEASIYIRRRILEENDFKLWGYVKFCNVLFDHRKVKINKFLSDVACSVKYLHP